MNFSITNISYIYDSIKKHLRYSYYIEERIGKNVEP